MPNSPFPQVSGRDRSRGQVGTGSPAIMGTVPPPYGRDSSPTPTHWTQLAACRGTDDARFWFNDEASIVRQVRRDYCDPCHVQLPCLADALATGSEGIWGGLTTDQRKRLGA